ncbi:MAG: hypothetical protein LKK12_06265 [Bacteroidales bacterium]|jgi:hypothetical protein|nr:hypothetical protein [Bacteroidales bacterium]MCI2133969.1 hypothetical protein [Bacteroidales bacterium]
MRKLIFITTVIIAITASSFSISAQKIEPEPLTFRKTYQMQAMSQKELYRLTSDWEEISPIVEFRGFLNGFDGKYYRLYCPTVDFGNRSGIITGIVELNIRDNAFDLVLSNISFRCGNKVGLHISSHDDNFNRTKFWLLTHNKRIIDKARAKSSEIFDCITSLMDEYINSNHDGPIELSAMKTEI